MTTGRLVFDGECGFCTWTVQWLRRLDRRRRVELVPLQAHGAAESVGVSVVQAQESVRWQESDGTRRAGAGAANAALAAAIGTRLPLRIYSGTARLQERLYDWVSVRRGRFPGVRPYCASHPEECRK